MKRLLVLSVVLVPLSLFIAGCGGTGGSSGKPLQAKPEEQKKMAEQMQKAMQQTKTGTVSQQAPGGGTPGEAAKK